MVKAIFWAALASLGWACTATDVDPPEVTGDAQPLVDARVDRGPTDGGRLDAVVDAQADGAIDAATDARIDALVDQGRSVDAFVDPDGALPPDMAMLADARVADAGPVPCDPQRVLATNGCTDVGCHSPPIQFVDLAAPNLAARLINAEAQSGGCEGRLLIDPNEVHRSLLLQAVGAAPPPAGDVDACQVQMPLGAYPPLSDDDRACLTSWVEDVAADHRDAFPPVEYEPASVESALRKVKTLLIGTAPTADELAQVQADPATLRPLVEAWTQTDEFETKLSDFLVVALQQRVQLPLLTLTADQFDNFRQSGRRAVLLKKILEESFVRTAVDIVQRDVAFDRVVLTNQWMVTTANLVLLRYLEQTFAEREQMHTLYRPADGEERPPLSTQVQEHNWAVAGLDPDTCRVPQTQMLSVLFGFVDARRFCEPQPNRNLLFNDGALTDADFEDWRLVRFIGRGQAGPDDREIPFYDVPALREANQIVSRLPRIGFFTTPTFLGNWATNPDNQFRVTTNQTLLGALHVGFAAAEPTEPVSDAGLNEEHAVPGTACYGCHRQLDPMRVYFGRLFSTRYQRPRGDGDNSLIFDPADENPIDPSFAFRGVVNDDGGGLGALARILTDHPRFPVAWVQKLCLYANSARCDESDPVFTALVEGFSNGLNLRTLIVDLFSSSLVTGLTQTRSWHPEGPPISITRRGHLCALLALRTGFPDVCSRQRVRDIIGLIPQDNFSRGAVDPVQPARPSAFHFAAAESLCDAVARSVLFANPDSVFNTSNPEQTLDRMVTRLMALPEGHPRHAPARAALEAHFQAIRADDTLSRALRSTFSVACLSPDVMGVGL